MSQLVEQVRQLGLQHIQLALGGFLGMDDAQRQRELHVLRASGLILTAGMIGFSGEDYTTIATIRETGGYVPDAQWPARKQITLSAGRLAANLDVKMLTTHIGFVPRSGEPKYRVMVDRISEVAEALGAMGVELLMETGQESAPELLQFLNDLRARNVGVNFDPANMILYGAGDPIQAIRTLGRHIRHVHVKDGRHSSQPRTTWGEETPLGAGQVRPVQFLRALNEVGYTGVLSIEREGGQDRVTDVRTAVEALSQAATEL
jgi:sugar phosphate isomerase/epimerase